MIPLLIVIDVIASCTLILFILLHAGRGGGLSDMFGGGMNTQLGGSTVVERPGVEQGDGQGPAAPALARRSPAGPAGVAGGIRPAAVRAPGRGDQGPDQQPPERAASGDHGRRVPRARA